MVMKMLKCKKETLMTSHFITLYWSILASGTKATHFFLFLNSVSVFMHYISWDGGCETFTVHFICVLEHVSVCPHVEIKC